MTLHQFRGSAFAQKLEPIFLLLHTFPNTVLLRVCYVSEPEGKNGGYTGWMNIIPCALQKAACDLPSLYLDY